MMKTPIQRARVHVTMRNKTEGSVLQGTVQASCLGIEAQVELESDQPAERVAAVVRNAEHGCFTMQALLAPVEVTSSITLNGAPLPAVESGAS
jgi:hypothetical protein